MPPHDEATVELIKQRHLERGYKLLNEVHACDLLRKQGSFATGDLKFVPAGRLEEGAAIPEGLMVADNHFGSLWWLEHPNGRVTMTCINGSPE
jgi:hypothetical protein